MVLSYFFGLNSMLGSLRKVQRLPDSLNSSSTILPGKR
jgi:hypothetical protein